MWTNIASPEGRRVAIRMLRIPTAFAFMSSNGRLIARSWLGWAAMWTISASFRSWDQTDRPGSVADYEFDLGEGEGRF